MDQLTPSTGLLHDLTRRDAPFRSGSPAFREGSRGSLESLSVRAERLEFESRDDSRHVRGLEEKLSVDAVFRDGNSVTHIELDVTRTVLSYGGAVSPEAFRDSLLEAVPEDVRVEIEGYLGESDGALPDLLSPQAVSERIFEFARAGYLSRLGDAEDSSELRGTFLDFIRPAIHRGFDEALEILEPFLDEKTTALVEETRGLVDEQLDSFAGVEITA